MRASVSGGDPARARTSFEWLPGRRFLIQRWQVDHPQAPDGIAVIGPGAGGSGLLQHYFDSRGVLGRRHDLASRLRPHLHARQRLNGPAQAEPGTA